MVLTFSFVLRMTKMLPRDHRYVKEETLSGANDRRVIWAYLLRHRYLPEKFDWCGCGKGDNRGIDQIQTDPIHENSTFSPQSNLFSFAIYIHRARSSSRRSRMKRIRRRATLFEATRSNSVSFEIRCRYHTGLPIEYPLVCRRQEFEHHWLIVLNTHIIRELARRISKLSCSVEIHILYIYVYIYIYVERERERERERESLEVFNKRNGKLVGPSITRYDSIEITTTSFPLDISG